MFTLRLVTTFIIRRMLSTIRKSTQLIPHPINSYGMSTNTYSDGKPKEPLPKIG